MNKYYQLLKPIIGLLLGTGLSKSFQFIYVILAAKFLSIEEFGVYSICLTLMLIALSPILGFGSELIVTSASANRNDSLYYQAFYWKVFIYPLGALATVLAGKFFYDIKFWPLFITSLLILSRSMELNVLSAIRGKGHNFEESRYLAISRGVSLITLILIFTFFDEYLNTLSVLSVQIIGILAFLPFVIFKHLKFIPSKLDPDVLKKLLWDGFPLAISSITWLIYFKVDVLMVGKIIDASTAGIYEFAYKILEAFFILPSVIMIVMFRRLSVRQGVESYKKEFLTSVALLSGLSLVTFTFSLLIAPKLLVLFIKPEQLQSIEILGILSYAVPFVFLGYLTTQLMVIQKQRQQYMWTMIFGAIFNVLLNLKLIPEYGAFGAGLSTVCSEALIFTLTLYFILSKFGSHLREG